MDELIAGRTLQGHKVFVCYAREDQGDITADIEWLRALGVDVWHDQDISAGMLWQEEIVRAIDDASLVLAYVSRASMDSPHCDREIAYAVDQDKRVLPVRLDDAPLTASLRITLGRVQMIQRQRLDEPSYRQRILTALAGSSGAPAATTLSPRAGNRRGSRQLMFATLIMVAALLLSNLIGGMNPDDPPVAAPPDGPVSLAVLPFADPDPDPESFADGITEEIQSLLTQVPGLRVTSRTSAFSVRDVAEDLPSVAARLGVSHVVEGSVRRSGGIVRVTGRLVDVAADAQIWSASYDRKVTEVFALQSEIAAQIARRLTTALSTDELSAIGRRPTDNLEAWQLFVRARSLFRDRTGRATDTEEALSLADRALALDPEFARAHSLRAALLLIQAAAHADPDAGTARLGAAETAALTANGLAPELGEPHFVLARVAELGGRFADAEQRYREAVRRAPNNADGRSWYGDFLLASGYRERAWEEKRRAVALDPLSPIIFWQVAFAAVALGRLDEVEGFIERSRANGWSSWEPEALLGAADMQRGDYAGAEAHYSAAFPRGKAVIAQSFAAIRAGEISPEFRALLDQLMAYGPLGAARWHVELLSGDLDAAYRTAFAELDQETLIQADGSDGPVRHASGKPREVLRIDWWGAPARPFRQDPRFPGLMRSVGLMDHWTAHGWPDLCTPVAGGLACN